MTLARQIQLTLLPESCPSIPGFGVAWNDRLARGLGRPLRLPEVGHGGGECDRAMADVSGKGMAASLLAASFDALAVGPIEVGYPPNGSATGSRAGSS